MRLIGMLSLLPMLVLGASLPQLPPGEFVDTEVSTNIPFAVSFETMMSSGSEGDIVAKAEFTEFETGNTFRRDAPLTVVKVEMMVKVDAVGNDCCHRHKYGVRELVQSTVTPRDGASWACFSGADTTDNGNLRCPIHAATNPFELHYGGTTYRPLVSVIEPTGIEGVNVTAETFGIPLGCAGGIGLRMQFRVLPLDVSFSQIAVEEVPSTDGSHSGYFTNPYFAGEWCHSRETGAGLWENVDAFNVVGGLGGNFDRAALVDPLPRMTSGGVVTDDPSEMWIDGSNVWRFPFGWNRRDVETLSPPYGYFASGTTQTFTINSLGTADVRKLGHSASRDIFGLICFDEEE